MGIYKIDIMAVFPDVFEPTKVSFEVRNIEPASRHYFEDGFEVRVGKTAFTEIAVNLVLEGATELEIKVILDFYREMQGTTKPFKLKTDGVIFRNHPEFSVWVQTLYSDLDKGKIEEINWFFEGKPRVNFVAVGTYELNLTLKTWRRLFPNYSVSNV